MNLSNKKKLGKKNEPVNVPSKIITYVISKSSTDDQVLGMVLGVPAHWWFLLIPSSRKSMCRSQQPNNLTEIPSKILVGGDVNSLHGCRLPTGCFLARAKVTLKKNT